MGKRTEKVQHTRRVLLAGALTVLRESGVHGLTLDAVAQQAGVSKGGLLHHFESKEALVMHLLQDMMAQFAANVAVHEAQEAERPGRLLRAYVRASWDETITLFPALGALLAVSVLENSQLLALVQGYAHTWQQRLAADAASAGLPASRAHLIRQIADAAWFDQLIGISASDEEHNGLLAEVLALCERETA